MDSFGTPLKDMIRYHIGTITFASLLVSILRVMKIFVAMAACREAEGIVGIIGCICSCIACCLIGAL